RRAGRELEGVRVAERLAPGDDALVVARARGFRQVSLELRLHPRALDLSQPGPGAPPPPAPPPLERPPRPHPAPPPPPGAPQGALAFPRARAGARGRGPASGAPQEPVAGRLRDV